MSSGAPSSHAEKLGEASRVLNFIASAWRGFSGKKVSRSITPILPKPGRWICPMSFSKSSPRPSFHSLRKIDESSAASGPSDATPTSESKLSTVLPTVSPNSSPSSITSAGGTPSELRMETGIPAVLPGVKMLMSVFSRKRAMRSAPCPQSSKPFCHIAAVFVACSSTVIPFFAASSAFTHGSKLFPSSSGKVSSRFAMSPLGSMMIAGMLSIAASSNKARHNPVFPEPVIPSTTPWVTRSFESYITGSAVTAWVTWSYSLPR